MTQMPLRDYAADLTATVDRAAPILLPIYAEVNGRRPAKDKWSPREIIGHLIDSAANNHHRFVCAQWQSDLIFAGYDQEGWVRAQDYQHAPWEELVVLWATYNRHLARVMVAIPAEIRQRRHNRHNLHEVAWRPIPASEPATLDEFMADYVDHLHHHLGQIEALAGVTGLVP